MPACFEPCFGFSINWRWDADEDGVAAEAASVVAGSAAGADETMLDADHDGVGPTAYAGRGSDDVPDADGAFFSEEDLAIGTPPLCILV